MYRNSNRYYGRLGAILMGEDGLTMERWPTWLRWLLFLPAAVVAPFLWTFLARLFTPSFLEGGLLYDVLENALFGAILVLVGAWVSPARKAVALVLGAVVVLIAALSMAAVWLIPSAVSTPPWRLLLEAFSQIVGAGYATWQLVNMTEEQLRQ